MKLTKEQIERLSENLYDDEYYEKNICPECGARVAHEGGCKTCYSCGYSACV